MSNLNLHTPEGVRDIYNGEFQTKLAIEDTLKATIDAYGYMPISTPTFEFFDTFSKEVGTIPSNELYKFFDREGNTLVLRPDITPSIARASAMYFTEYDAPIRLTYQGNVFINYHSLQGHLKESTQIGCEFIGDASVDADAEMIAVVVNSLKACGLKEFKVNIGHVDLVRGLMSITGLDDEAIDDLRNLILNKNFYGVADYLTNKSVASDIIKLFDVVSRMYSDPKEWSQYLELAKPYTVVYSALKHLYDLNELLVKYQVADNVSFELGMHSDYKYYTGIIFSANTYGSGVPIVNGGRYDALLSYFGKSAPAIGFAILVDQLQASLKQQKITLGTTKPKTVILYNKNSFDAALKKACELRAKGNIAVLVNNDSNVDRDALSKLYSNCDITEV